MNRILALALTFALLSSGLAIVADNAEASNIYLINDSWTGNYWNGWGNSGAYNSLDSTNGNPSYCLYMTNSAAGFVYHPFTPPSGKAYTVQFDVRTSGSYNYCWVRFYTSTSTWDDSRLKVLQISVNTMKVLDASAWTTCGQNTAWVTVKIEVNAAHSSMAVTAGAVSLGTYSLDTGLAEPIGMRIGHDNGNNVNAYVDNVLIYYNGQVAWSPTITSTPGTAGQVGTAYSYLAEANESVSWAGVSLPSWAGISGNTVSGTPNATGTFHFNISATSTAGTLIAYQSWNVTVIPAPALWAPTLAGTPATGVRVGGYYYFIPSANESVSWNLTTEAGWASLNPTSGMVQGTIYTQDDVGTYPFSLRATSINGTLPAYINWSVTVSPTWKTTILSEPSTNFTLGHTWTYDLAVNETCVIAIEGMPSGCSFDEGTRRFTWTPDDLSWWAETSFVYHPEMQHYYLDNGMLHYPAWPTWEGGILRYVPMYQNFGGFAISVTSPGGLVTYQNFTVTVSRAEWTVHLEEDENHQICNIDNQDGVSDGKIMIGTDIHVRTLYNETCNVLFKVQRFLGGSWSCIASQQFYGANGTWTGFNDGWLFYSYDGRLVSGSAGVDQIGSYRWEIWFQSVNGTYPELDHGWIGYFSSFNITAPVPLITGTPLATGQVRVYYSWTAEADMAVIWSMDGTNGLIIDHLTGEVYGIPDAAGVFAVTIRATSIAYQTVGSLTWNLTVLPAEVVTDPPEDDSGGRTPGVVIDMRIDPSAFAGLALVAVVVFALIALSRRR